MSCAYGNHVLNNITADLNVLREAIIERNYFKGQVSCFLRKMFRVINVIYFFITKMFQISNYFKNMKRIDLKIICYIIVMFLFREPCSSIQYCCQIRNPNKINILHSQSQLHRLMYLKNAMMNYLDTFRHFSEDQSSF